jgi:hypothetical protein
MMVQLVAVSSAAAQAVLTQVAEQVATEAQAEVVLLL